MSRVRQLPEICLRGSLANETMKNLNDEQLAEVDTVFQRIAKHPILDGHKNKVIQKLGATIAGDYFDDRAVAMQEYQVAIWRATVHLLYHSDYEYICESCGKCSYYSSQRRKDIIFNRRYEICPNCNHVRIHDPKDSDLEQSAFVDHDQLLVLVSSLQDDGKEPPITRSSVAPIIGKQKVEDPYQIINDPDQVKKYFGQFIWNYFRQIIKENEITKHGKIVQTVSGPADYVTTEAVIGILRDFSITYNYDQRNPRYGQYRVDCNAYVSSPELTLRFCEIIHKVREHGVIIDVDHIKIQVSDLGGEAPMINLGVSKTETVLMMNKASNATDDIQVDTVDQVVKPDMFGEGISNFEEQERLSYVREALPDGDCKSIFDLTIGFGKIYDEFIASDPRAVQSNNGLARQNKIAKFLGITTKDVKRHHTVIGIHMKLNGICEI